MLNYCKQVRQLNLSLVFSNKAGHITGLRSKGRLLALPSNVRLGSKWFPMKNAPAYYTVMDVLKNRASWSSTGIGDDISLKISNVKISINDVCNLMKLAI